MMDVSLWDAAAQALQSRADAWLAVAVPVLKDLSLALWILVAASVLHLWAHEGPRRTIRRSPASRMV